MEVVTGVASSIVAQILEYPFRLIGRHLGYLFCYRANKQNLTNQVTELDNKKSSIQRRAHEAERNNEELEKCGRDWISEAERKIQEANGVIEDRGHENAKCSCNGSFPNLVSRYKLSKKAKIMAEKIVIDLQKANNFGNLFYRPHLQPSFKNEDFEAFDTRTQTLKEIMEALRDPNPTMIGVYGMGGIGKTTLVEEVAHQAKEEKCFSEFVMVTVSQDFDLKSIQKRIAKGLGLELDEEEDISARAIQLQHRLRRGNKILIILDDIWKKLDLSKAGISFNADAQKGCKILLVSRVRDVLCNLMGVTKITEVKVLSDSEAKGLFDKYVGDIDDNSDFKELANQVVGECGGLPIAIVTIACSLKNKDIFVWKDFLYRLKSSHGMEERVFSSIKISYDFLQSEEEKKLLLLCSLHREDANVSVNDLMFYGFGWDLFRGVYTMDGARCRAHSLVEKLKAHCLLLDGDYEGFVKMHDVIRDVMISIANNDEHMRCLTKVAELEHGDFRESKAIMLLGSDFNNQLFASLVCPKLQLLLAPDAWYLSLGTIPDDFFKEAQELKALNFYCEPLQSLPQSFCTLRHLRALRLRLGKNEDLTLIGELRTLIALDLSRSTFSQLPEHIGKLTRLRSLNLRACWSLKVIQPNVISRLVLLEELYMDGVNIDWEVEGRVGEERNASLMEFKHLWHLTTLHLNVKDALPKDMFRANLQRFRIVISRGVHSIKYLPCSLDVSDCPNLKSLFNVAMAGRLAQLERLQIRSCPVMEEVLITNEHGEGRLEKILFPKLKYLKLEDLPNLKRFCTGDCIECPSLLELKIEDCGALRMFISSNEQEVEGPFFNEKLAFPKLKALDVRRLNSVNSLFSFAVAESLVTLEKLHLWDCNLMEEIVQVNEQGEEGRLDKISFPKLQRIHFYGLSNLKRFFEKSEELMGSEAKQPLFNGKVTMPNLEALYVSGLNSVNSLFSFAVAESLVTLKMLEVSRCSLMEEIVQVNEQGEEGRLDKISFPKLESIHFEDLSNLKRFYEKSEELMGSEAKQPLFNGMLAFPKLKALDVRRLNSVNSLFSFAVAESFVTLEKLHLWDCNLMEEIVQANEQGEEGRLDKISFPKLQRIHFYGLSNLKRFFEKSEKLMGSEAKQPLFNGKVEFPKLEALYVSDLNSVNCLFFFAFAKSLVTLKRLWVSRCSLMEEIVQVNEQGEEGRLDKISFPKLERIHFRGLSNLKRFYEKSEELMGSEIKQPLFNGTVAFPKLEALSVSDLNSVNSLFSFAVAKSLVTLKKLEVRRCSLMEKIVQVNEQGRLDKISFPKLESIYFYGLSNLKRFYGGACIEFPSLLKLEMRANKETEERMDIVVAEQHLVFNEVLGPNLEKLTTHWSELIKEMCNCQSSRAPSFCNLKDVDLKCFRNEPIGFSLKCIQRYQNLESLSLSGFFVDTTHHHQQLMVSSEEHERPLKHLKMLDLFQLFMLTHLHEDSEDSENSSLENLKFLLIQECSRLKSPLLSSTTSFQNLMALVVSKCSAMINLLASSTAKTLVHLRLMSITECKQMTEIIAGEIVDVEIVFGKLEILELSDLPSLRSFHSAGNSVMRFPNLVMLIVSQCPEMRRFSSRTIDAPKLDNIISKIEKKEDQWDWLIYERDFDDESKFDDKMLTRLPKPQQKLWEGDINKTLEKLWEEDDYSLAMQRLFTDT